MGEPRENFAVGVNQLRAIRAFFQEKSDAKGLQKHSFIHSFSFKNSLSKTFTTNEG